MTNPPRLQPTRILKTSPPPGFSYNPNRRAIVLSDQGREYFPLCRHLSHVRHFLSLPALPVRLSRPSQARALIYPASPICRALCAALSHCRPPPPICLLLPPKKTWKAAAVASVALCLAGVFHTAVCAAPPAQRLLRVLALDR